MKKVYHRIIEIAGSVIIVEADGIFNEELAQITTRDGVSLAQVIRISGKRVALQVFSGSRGISTGDEVHFLGKEMQITTSENLLGRVYNGSGKPRDNGPDITTNMVDIGGPSVNPAKRIIPKNMIRTGIPMIDVFNSLVESQKTSDFFRCWRTLQ